MYESDKPDGPWKAATGMMTASGNPLQLPGPAILNQDKKKFFRFDCREYDVEIDAAGGFITNFKVNEPTPLANVMDRLEAALGYPVYHADNVNEFATIVPVQCPTLPTGRVTLDDLSDLINQPIWTPPLDGTSPAMPPLPEPDMNLVAAPPPGDVGIGVMEDGWAPTFPTAIPTFNATPIPGVDSSMPITGINLLPVDPYDGAERIEFGNHDRACLLIGSGGTSQLLNTMDNIPGYGIPPGSAPFPRMGGIVWTVANVFSPTNLIYVGGMPNPNEVRNYAGTPDGFHEVSFDALSKVSLTLPYDQQSTTTLGDIVLNVYRVVDAPPEQFLEKATVLNHIFNGILDLIGSYNGAQLAPLSKRRPQPSDDSFLKSISESSPPTITALRETRSPSEKFNVVILGDGFDNSVADQSDFNSFCQNTILDAFDSDGISLEIGNALNIYRVNTFSTSGQLSSLTTDRATALGWIYSGIFTNCWMQPLRSNGVNQTFNREDAIIDSLLPQGADIIITVLNTTGQGGWTDSQLGTGPKPANIAFAKLPRQTDGKSPSSTGCRHSRRRPPPHRLTDNISDRANGLGRPAKIQSSSAPNGTRPKSLAMEHPRRRISPRSARSLPA